MKNIVTKKSTSITYKFTFFIFFILTFIPLKAQLLPGGEKDNYELKKDNSGNINALYGALEVKGALLDNDLTYELGTKAGLLFSNSSIGFVAFTRISKTVEKNTDPNNRPQSFFNFKYYGLYYDYISSKKSKTFFNAGLSGSLGYTSYEKSISQIDNYSTIKDYYLILEPNVSYNIKVWNNNYIGLGLGYRKAIGLWSANQTNYFSGPIFTLSYKFLN
ncbi:MAG: hypothetical protein NTW25_11460 [Candidatus Kapabacteria bacterium]|nr:hypothetical protein [Candidatus Kapabacteria bacterium]